MKLDNLDHLADEEICFEEDGELWVHQEVYEALEVECERRGCTMGELLSQLGKEWEADGCPGLKEAQERDRIERLRGSLKLVKGNE